jgi:ABC-type transporter Mla subunit MlaD
MRRIGLTLLLIAAGAAVWMAASASAGSTRTYKVELDNAFGLVNGSEVRVAGVKAGTVKSLDVNADKKAVITVEVDSKFGEFKADATCSSEPQSLIAEYFLDCQPGQSTQPLPNGEVPVAQTTGTVPNDLVQNILREPYKRGLQLLINEFGTALTGNAENLNAAILRGAPALRQLKTTLDILGAQNKTIADLNFHSDTIVAQLNNRREDVVKFIKEANDTATASAERRAALGETFKLLPDFLAQLQPTMLQLGRVASEGKPLLTDLHKSSHRLTVFSQLLPPFNNATTPALTTLGSAAEVGTRALIKGQDEINQLRVSTTNASSAADLVNQFFDSISNPKNAVEEDARARTDLSLQPGEADRRVNLLNQKTGGGVTEPGYTGMEGLLNYVYYQTGALNQFDQIGHLLHFALYDVQTSPCASYNAGPTYPNGGTDPKTADHCVAVLGDNQPGINGQNGPTGNLPRYDNSVCPQGSTDLALCDPAISTNGGTRKVATGTVGNAKASIPPAAQQLLTPQVVQDIQDGKAVPKPLQQLLGPNGTQQLEQTIQQLTGDSNTSSSAGPDKATATDLLNFLFGQ